MYKYYFIIITLIATIVIISFYNNSVSGNSDKGAENDINIEDSIIIKGIQMDTYEPPIIKDSNIDGQIIYDDSFDDSIEEYNAIKNEPDKKSAFEKLKKKDFRWHLTRYQIKKHDNLWGIAAKFNVNYNIIISINNIKNPDMLKPGKWIDVPNRIGVNYKIKKGDTIFKIAKKYNIDRKTIVSFNNLNKNKIKADTVIFLPDASEKKEKKVVIKKEKNEYTRIKTITSKMKFLWPIKGKITSGFGVRKDPFSGKKGFHCGIDISANVGSPVRSSLQGTVIYSGWKDGYGKVVIIKHNNGYISVYAHNKKNLVKSQDKIKKGDIIAYSGMTGAVTGAHVHFEIRKYVTPLNPLRFL